MKIGHLDGKDRIYDSEGELILKANERLHGRYQNVFLDITNAWRTWLVGCLFAGDAGRMICYITDQRIVFVRRPDVHKAGAYLMTPYGAAEGIADMYKARKILEKGGFEYCEILPDDVRFFRKVRTGVILLLIDKGRKHAAFIMTHTVIPASFGETMNSWLELKGIPKK